MDSFYDQPRTAPKPTNINKLTGPRIPEVSLIQPPIINSERVYRPQAPHVPSYNTWKSRNIQSDKENYEFSDHGIRKHVRFESPRGGFNNSQVPYLQNEINHPIKQLDNFRPEGRLEGSKDVKTKTLEELYLSNAPKRNLDLNVNEIGNNFKANNYQNCYDIYNYKKENDDFSQLKENKTVKEVKPESYQDYKRRINQNYENYGSTNQINSRDLCDKLIRNDDHHYNRFNYYNEPPIQRENKELVKRHKEDDEPTTRDLLKVIQQQNEQILLLQKQVACLLEAKTNQKQIEPPSINITDSQTEDQYKKMKKGPLSKIAIDVMTSFEVSFRPQNQNFPKNKLKDSENSLKIEEIQEGDVKNVLDGIKKCNKFDKADDDVSLSLTEPLKVVERCPSPEQSIHVDMQDYSSDEEDAESDLGWTLYNNIMGQVNNIFQNAQSEPQSTQNTNLNGVKDKTLRRVKEATMKHLKSIGVNLPLIDESVSKETKSSSDEFDSSDVSFAVKQLLMKYLPDEQLAKLTCNEAKEVQLNDNPIKRRPEFSFATIQYMRKYNLLSSSDPQNKVQPTQKPTPKILDVTALKQQPKLL